MKIRLILVLGALGLLGFNLPAISAEERLLTKYVADIGPGDHYNSGGKQLSSFAVLIAQDRANYHRFGIRHEHDGYNPVFSQRSMRAQVGSKVPKVESYFGEFVKHVVSSDGAGGAYIILYVYGRGNRITRISIDVHS
ncbi:hypothetical protein J7481_22900 [Labrenzia sp. R4_2]|uniref:hypothetical protein n=1 Tax=Labrenzia sp. R4_2 TaxID=2821107 RepID=UPI001ADB795B|nr:hypothetical protein [Labrenzia sp. R4_2]MBO9422377.1 hypothetical protein [Labrenzia sp. R4_2]